MLLHHGLAGSRLQLLNNWIFDSEKVDSSGSAFFLRFLGNLVLTYHLGVPVSVYPFLVAIIGEPIIA